MAMKIRTRATRVGVLLAIMAASMLPTACLAAGGIDDQALRAAEAPPDAIWVDSLDLGTMHQDWGTPHAGKSVEGNPLQLNGVVYPHGVGTHAESELTIELKAAASKFVAMVGVDDEKKGQGSVQFSVWVDGKQRAETKVLRGGDPPERMEVDLTGARLMILFVWDGNDGISSDHADWAGAMIVLEPGATERPQAVRVGDEPPPPIASGSSPVPAIHGPRIVGATPGKPFLFLIPATGEGPLTFAARNLPPGLSLDPKTGIISGALKYDGRRVVSLTVKGPRGSATRKLIIAGGRHKLAMTPPMGWNSWNVWAGAIDDQKVRQAADWMAQTGLAAHGYQFINIDDTWEAGRAADGEILTNKKFPDMKALSDYVHSKGLKLGIYSSPGPTTCAGFEGSYRREQQDANTYAKWGIDYLKYDWCSYGGVAPVNDVDDFKKPYRVMRAALDKCGRDIVYSLCQYGMGEVWKWGAEVGGNLWRTTGDIGDSWGSMSSIGFAQDGHEKYAGPGHWNDPDMLVVGKVGWGPNLHPSNLTPNEQITHISLWCLLAAPLLIGCDMSQMDQFTIDLLSNDEVLDVNQDPLGKAAGRRARNDLTEVWARPLWDGTMAVGLFNRSPLKGEVTARWEDLGLTGSQPVRDLWQHKDLGVFDGSFSATVPAHATVLVKIGKPNRTDW
jgi:alpha-galactosidase